MLIDKYEGEEMITQTFLANKLNKTLSTINYNVDKLKKEGFIE